MQPGDIPPPGVAVAHHADGCVSLRLTATDGVACEQILTPTERDALVQLLTKKP
jgi:hypothetical protein